jgi:5'-deoxynucleotidase YfbR-like HD superfamily hydrolase
VNAQPGTAINTRNRHVVDFASPDPKEICLEDIAWGLAHVCRFGAQANKFYSVAQHSVTVADAVGHMGYDELSLLALHHDSHEAFTCDIPSPLKLLLGTAYTDITERLDIAIAEALNLSWPAEGSDGEATIKAADKAVLHREADELLPGWVGADGAPDKAAMKAARKAMTDPLDAWGFELAERRFRERHDALSG